MFKKNSKYRLTFLVLTTVVFSLGAVMSFYRFQETNKGMEMVGTIVFGIMALVYTSDIYEFIKNKKSTNSGV